MLGVLVLGLGGAWIMGACGSSEPSEAGSLGPGVDPPDPTAEAPLAIKQKLPPSIKKSLHPSVPSLGELAKCSDIAVKQCKSYRIQLLGDPTNNIELRKKYKAALESACYVSATNTFNCFYKTPQKACQDVLLVPKVFGAAPYEDHPTTCKQIPGTENWSLQIGSDPANVTYMYYVDPPPQHPLIWVDGVPTLEINGPYRNLPEPSTVEPGKPFDCYRIDGVLQKERILQMNRKKNGGVIRSDLAFFTWPCPNEPSGMCTEKEFLNEPSDVYDADAAQVDHVASKKDPRGCDWGTNSNKNAAVVSAKLNRHFSNNERSKEVVDMINAIPAYTP